MKFFTNKSRSLLETAGFPEKLTPVENPGRGWYHIYTFAVGGSEAFLQPVSYEKETIALVLFDIGKYREKPLDESALEAVREVFLRFAEKKTELIVRVTYDTIGKGMEREPSSFSLVQQHMRQLAPILLEYRDNILVHQGLFIGSWGEMHSSRFLTKEHLKQLTAVFHRETQGLVKLAFRRPMQYRTIMGKKHSDWEIGFYNDAMLGSKSHLGTFGEGECLNAGWEEPWRPKDEIKFMEPLIKKVLMGGEAVWAHRPLNTQETLRELRELQVSYLNCVHDETRLNQWRETRWEGVSLYEYIGVRLGYCLVVRSAELLEQRGIYELRLQIENIGFSYLYEDTVLRLYAGHSFLTELPCALKELAGGQSSLFILKFKADFKKLPEGTELFLNLKRSRDERTIYFANEYTDGKLFLGRIRQS